MATLGGIQESTGFENSIEIDGLDRFAVDEHNKKENALLEFARVVEAQEQVVAGTLHHLTIEVIDVGKKKLYEAKAWVKPWMKFKELQEFKHASDVPSFTSSDLGDKKDGRGPEWKDVPVNDLEVQDATNHAVKTIQQRSNSLFPYELLEIVLANAECSGCLACRNKPTLIPTADEPPIVPRVHDCTVRKRSLSEDFGTNSTRETVSDVVEALIGAFLFDSGFKAVTAFLRWIGIEINVEASRVNDICLESSSYLPCMDVSALQNLLGYKFLHRVY